MSRPSKLILHFMASAGILLAAQAHADVGAAGRDASVAAREMSSRAERPTREAPARAERPTREAPARAERPAPEVHRLTPDARAREYERVQRVDPPIKSDPLGNALVGGAAAGVATGIKEGVAAGLGAAAISTARGAAIGEAVQTAKESISKNKADNLKSGRGGPNDPRYDPRTLLNR